MAREWIVNNIKLDGNGDPLPAYEVDECDVYFDPDGDGVFWAETLAMLDADGDNKISSAEWPQAYGILSMCACENAEALEKVWRRFSPSSKCVAQWQSL